MNEWTHAKQVFLKLVAASNGRIAGTVRLVKAFYFAHLYYWTETGLQLTGHKIIRLPYGPVPDDYKMLLGELCDSNQLIKTTENSGTAEDTEIYQLASVDVDIAGESVENAAIRRAAEFVKGKSGQDLIRYTHKYSNSWNEAADRDQLDIGLDSMSPEDFQAMKARMADAREKLTRAIKR